VAQIVEVTTGPVAVGAVDTVIVAYTVPQYYAARLHGLGHSIDVGPEWVNVVWNINVDGNPIKPEYANFIRQIGKLAAPFYFTVLPPLRQLQVVTLTARRGATAVNAFSRLLIALDDFNG
jgi:hypothetical protein